jgi:hypothetical protein
LLLRSSYETVEALRFIPMDRFQSVQWKRRAAEQEVYLKRLAPLRPAQGDLTDPLYFDLLSYVQLLVVSELMPKGELVFEQLVGAVGEKRVIRRPAELADNALLPDAYERLVGDKVVERLRDGFEDAVFGGPAPCAEGNFACALAGCQSILTAFESGGFAFSLRVTDADESAKRIGIHVEGGANLYALAELTQRRGKPLPAWLEYSLLAFLRQSGWTDASVRTRLSRTGSDIEVMLVSS